MKLPRLFVEEMKYELGEEFPAFIDSFRRQCCRGLRVNTLKIDVDAFLKISPFDIERIPWTEDGFYYSGSDSPGRHPYYYAGLYYIQEPSAMLPVTLLDIRPGEKVLDLCAAPGGKSVQIAARMNGQGVLVSNEIDTGRAKALVKNIELCGVTNAVVTMESPEKLEGKFPNYFDKILVDAPCSGEGMFRKDENAAKSWERFERSRYHVVQKAVLHSAGRMLKPGGLMVYSTCTFNQEENEGVVEDFLNRHPEFELVNIDKHDGMAGGFTGDYINDMKKCVRLWPHKLRGEGHFAALLRRKGEISVIAEEMWHSEEADEINIFFDFARDNLCCDESKFDPGRFMESGGSLYLVPMLSRLMEGIRVAKPGWYLGNVKCGRFEPSHSLVMALKGSEIVNKANFDAESVETARYLKGETLFVEKCAEGFCAVCVDGYPLGWAKNEGGRLKNLYPKGWRKMN
jgi:NOL1/NOP2/sun family putative RNA methylase